MSRRGMLQHLPEKKLGEIPRVTVKGWKRQCSHYGRNNRYLTLVKDEAAVAKYAALIEVTPDELEILKEHERGFKMVDFTHQVDPLPSGEVEVLGFVSIPPQDKNIITRSYLDRVLEDLTPEQQEEVLAETDFYGAEIDEQG